VAGAVRTGATHPLFAHVAKALGQSESVIRCDLSDRELLLQPVYVDRMPAWIFGGHATQKSSETKRPGC